SARLMPILIGSPLCAAAFESESSPRSNDAAHARSAFPTFQAMASSLEAARRCAPPLSFSLLVHCGRVCGLIGSAHPPLEGEGRERSERGGVNFLAQRITPPRPPRCARQSTLPLQGRVKAAVAPLRHFPTTILFVTRASGLSA